MFLTQSANASICSVDGVALPWACKIRSATSRIVLRSEETRPRGHQVERRDVLLRRCWALA